MLVHIANFFCHSCNIYLKPIHEHPIFNHVDESHPLALFKFMDEVNPCTSTLDTQ